MNAQRFEGLSLPYRPPVQDGELVLGYIYRCMFAGGHVRMKDLAKTLVDRITIQAPWSLPSNLNRLAAELAPVISSPVHLMLEHTCMPAYLPFAVAGSQAAVLKHIYEGLRHKGLASALGLAGKFVESRPCLGACSACMREDELRLGFSYWHREHALAGVTYCARHGEPLLVGCGMCRYSQVGNRQPQLPQRECRCGQVRREITPGLSAAEGAVLTRMARYASQLLKSALTGTNATQIGRYYQHCAHAAGYRDGTRVDSRGASEELERRYSPAVLSALNATLSDSRKWSSFVLGKAVAPPVLGRNLLLFDFFGGKIPNATELGLAEEGYQRRCSLRAHARRPSSVGDIGGIAADRDAISDFLHTHIGATRSVVLKALGRVAMRARERDASWYYATVPGSSRGGNTNDARQVAENLDDLDERASMHVLRRSAELLRSTSAHPKQITRTVLLKGFARGNEIVAEYRVRLPRTTAAIEASIETREEFQRRYAMAILAKSKNKLDLFTEVRRRTGLSAAQVEELNFYFCGERNDSA